LLFAMVMAKHVECTSRLLPTLLLRLEPWNPQEREQNTVGTTCSIGPMT
jgi:hypothetical protein